MRDTEAGAQSAWERFPPAACSLPREADFIISSRAHFLTQACLAGQRVCGSLVMPCCFHKNFLWHPITQAKGSSHLYTRQTHGCPEVQRLLQRALNARHLGFKHWNSHSPALSTLVTYATMLASSLEALVHTCICEYVHACVNTCVCMMVLNTKQMAKYMKHN